MVDFVWDNICVLERMRAKASTRLPRIVVDRLFLLSPSFYVLALLPSQSDPWDHKLGLVS